MGSFSNAGFLEKEHNLISPLPTPSRGRIAHGTEPFPALYHIDSPSALRKSVWPELRPASHNCCAPDWRSCCFDLDHLVTVQIVCVFVCCQRRHHCRFSTEVRSQCKSANRCLKPCTHCVYCCWNKPMHIVYGAYLPVYSEAENVLFNVIIVLDWVEYYAADCQECKNNHNLQEWWEIKADRGGNLFFNVPVSPIILTTAFPFHNTVTIFLFIDLGNFAWEAFRDSIFKGDWDNLTLDKVSHFAAKWGAASQHPLYGSSSEGRGQPVIFGALVMTLWGSFLSAAMQLNNHTQIQYVRKLPTEQR